ncbi:hypothetical protein EBZ39_15170, partial [bacterium]|nr:hypothetical protein [bacterium]
MTVPGCSNPLLMYGNAGGYQISRSLRFSSGDSSYLSRTPGSAGNRTTWTWAGWVKYCVKDTGARQVLFSAYNAGNDTDYFEFGFGGPGAQANALYFSQWSVDGASTAVFRDPSAWYHVVANYNGSNLAFYVNNTQVLQVAKTGNLAVNGAFAHAIGRQTYNTGRYFDGYLAEVYFIDGQALDPSSFTTTDATTGQLIPKAFSGGSYGTNGFHLDFADNSSNTASTLGKDTSGNGNNWTPNNLTAYGVKSLAGVFFGTGNVLTAPSSSDFNLGTGDFTIEYYLNRTTIGSNDAALTNYAQVNSGYLICLHSNSTDVFLFLNGSNVVSGGTPEANKWIHYAFVRSGTTCTIYKNGVSIASATSSAQAGATNVMNIGAYSDATSAIKGILSNVRIVKGTALYTSNFTPPSAPLSNVTNTVLLCCQSSTSATAATVSPGTITATGSPVAGNYNDSSASLDSLVDVPTSSGTDTGAGGEVRGNYATLNPLNNGGVTLVNGNLDWTRSAAGSTAVAYSTIAVSSGKWYFETTMNGAGGGVNWECGVATTNTANNIRPGTTATGWGLVTSSNTIIYKQNNNSLTSIFSGTLSTGDVIGVAIDLDNGRIWFARNNTWLEGSPSAGTGASYTNLSSTVSAFFGGDGSAVNGAANFGQRPFAYTAPSGFKALCTTNLPAPLVTKP